MWTTTYLAVAPLAILVLTVDRCLAIKFHLHYSKSLQTKIVTFGAVIIILATIAFTLAALPELPLNMAKVSLCENVACVTIKIRNQPQLLSKTIFATVNVICSLFFFYTLRKAARGNESRIKNRAVKITILLEIFLNIIPGYFAYFFNVITGEVSSNYVGQISMLLCTADAAICATFYSLVDGERKYPDQFLSILRSTKRALQTLW
ncbi:hypothetical protein Ddc_17695 [Ditylenchus destructor]|nr:hypothetical protein Ddc_17695 [Ditylenchus destructor]